MRVSAEAARGGLVALGDGRSGQKLDDAAGDEVAAHDHGTQKATLLALRPSQALKPVIAAVVRSGAKRYATIGTSTTRT